MVRSGLLCFDEEKRCVFANLAASEILGLSPEELIGKSREEVLELQGRREAGQPADAGRKDSAEISFDLSFDNKPNGAAAPAITLLAGLDPESGRLVRDSRESMLLFRQVEKVRMEWEIIMDRIGDAVFLLDRDDAVSRCNYSAKKVLDKDFSQIIGRNIWILLHQSGIDAFHADKIEAHQKNTGRWFVLNFYELGETGGDLRETGGERLGRVLTLYDSTALKKAHELEEKNALISRSREELKTALDGISALIKQVVESKGFEVRFENPHLSRCYEMLSCKKEDCPCYGRGASRCWQKEGTYCGGEVQGAFAKKIKNCVECPVFRGATKDPVYEIGEHFNNMMNLLEINNNKLKNAHYELAEKTALIIENKEKLETALDGISALMQKVVDGKGFEVRFENPFLPKCYEVLSCMKNGCPCYGRGAARCWQMEGTFCGGEVQGAFAQKIKNCVECPVFMEATKDPIYQIGEYFNNMMQMLGLSNGELATAYSELKSAQSQMLQQEKMASIGQLAAGVAHEINNPIAFVMSNLNSFSKYVSRLKDYIEAQAEAMGAMAKGQDPAAALGRVNEAGRLLKIDSVTKDVDTLIAESLDGADRVRQIVRNLKDFSHVDESEFKYADINAGLASTINIVWNELKYKAELEKEFGGLPLVKCNPGQLNQVFLNLLVNAAQAIEKSGRIKVKSWRDPQYVYIRVSDTGCGIPSENIPRIFDPFFTTKEVGKGTGLGLSIAYDIVKKHRGEINVESAAGTGTAFTVKIPIGPEDTQPEVPNA